MAAGVRSARFLLVLIAAAVLFPAVSQGLTTPVPVTFIDAPDSIDMVHDAARNMLYITTTTGDLLRYNIASREFLSPITLGGNLRGIDISPDNNTLAVADLSCDSTQQKNWIHIVDLPSNQTRKIEIDFNVSGESGTWSTAFTDNNTVWVTSDYGGSGWLPIEKVNVTTGDVTNLLTAKDCTMLVPSADHNYVAYIQPGNTAGAFGRYRTSDDNLITANISLKYLYEIGVSRDGTQYAVPTNSYLYVFDENLESIGQLGLDGDDMPRDVVYDPNRDRMYVSWYNWSFGTEKVPALQAYDTNTLAMVEVIDDRTNVFTDGGAYSYEAGRLRISDDGNLLFARVEDGVNMYVVPEPSCACLLATAVFFLWRRTSSRQRRR
ncbi:MAG: hypothetical protein JW888_09020 [Pirellulales bacterium]|nr:hypothetical protein [Pirellulales bacterium]